MKPVMLVAMAKRRAAITVDTILNIVIGLILGVIGFIVFVNVASSMWGDFESSVTSFNSTVASSSYSLVSSVGPTILSLLPIIALLIIIGAALGFIVKHISG
jgi:ABC-type lipoprotein release transport system permease subunit